jgi:cytochrome P450
MIATPKAEPALFNPLLPAFREDPHPFFHRLRQTDPVHWSAVLQLWVLTRYDDCVAALKDDRLSANARNWSNYSKFWERGGAQESSPAAVYRHWMLQLDPPDHTRLRALVNKAFTPRVVESMRPRIECIVNELLDAAEHHGKMDVVADLAYPLPLRVIADLLGTPPEDYEQIRIWSAKLLPSFGPVMSRQEFEQISQVLGEFRRYFQDLVMRRRRQPANCLLDGLIAARDGASSLSDAELVSTCILLIFAGHFSAVQLISDGVLTMLRHPQQIVRLNRQPDLIITAIEEMLRFESPLQMINRAAVEDLVIDGKTIAKNQMLLISLPAANRDPRQFPEPDRFDIARRDNRHIAFGYGIHYCAGAPLARVEGQIAIATLLRRFPNLHLTGEKLQRHPSLLVRGLKSLKVRFHPPGQIAKGA